MDLQFCISLFKRNDLVRAGSFPLVGHLQLVLPHRRRRPRCQVPALSS